MKATLMGEFGSATIDLPDSAKDDPAKLQAYIDHFEKNAADIKAGRVPLPDFDTFQPSGIGFSAPGHGMGDLKAAESAAPAMNPDKWLPGRKQMEVDAMSQGKTVNPVLGALATVADVANIPTRAAAQFRGQDMSDPNAYFWRPEVEKMKLDTTGEGAAAAADQQHHEALMKEYGTDLPGLSSHVTPSAINAGIEMAGQMASDPLMVLSTGGKVIAGLTRKGLEALHGAIPGLKNYIAGLSQIKQPLLEKAATQEGMDQIKAGASMNPQDLAQQIAGDAGKVNQYREDLASGSRATQAQQVQAINDDLALENQKVNTQLGQDAEDKNDYLQRLAENSRATQQGQAEQAMLEARRAATGAEDASLRDIKPGALGEEIKSDIMGGKGEMQDQWVTGDQKSVGPYRSAPAAMGDKISKASDIRNKLLTDKLGQIQEKYKAYEPLQGMRRISEGAAQALNDLSGHAQLSGHTVDDLLNIKAELRRMRGMDKYKGIPFDATTDDVALGEAGKAIDDVIAVSLKKAAPKQAGTILDMMRAKDRQYAVAKNYLGDLAKGMGQTQNSAAIIQKVKNLGPQKAREFIAAASANPAIAGMVPKLRQAFVDDLILSSMKDGQFSAQDFARKWAHPGMQEMKSSWLAPEDLKRIDDATALGTAEIGTPGKIPTPRVQMPPKVGSPGDRSQGFYSQLARQDIENPPKVGQSFSYNGQPDPITAKTRVENIGNDNEINQRALQDLQTLDKINKTNYAQKAMQIFEAGKLGMTPESNALPSSVPMATTGRAGLGVQKGQALGRLVRATVGGIGGGLLGHMVGHGAGLVAGAGAGGYYADLLGNLVAHMHSNLASPAGAIASYKKLNAVLEARYPRAAKIAAAMEKTQDVAKRARLEAMLQQALSEAQQGQ